MGGASLLCFWLVDCASAFSGVKAQRPTSAILTRREMLSEQSISYNE